MTINEWISNTHKLQTTKINETISNNKDEIVGLRNHNKTLVTKIKKLKSNQKPEQAHEDIEKKLEKIEKNYHLKKSQSKSSDKIIKKWWKKIFFKES